MMYHLGYAADARGDDVQAAHRHLQHRHAYI
jgi:hypothetical protein